MSSAISVVTLGGLSLLNLALLLGVARRLNQLADRRPDPAAVVSPPVPAPPALGARLREFTVAGTAGEQLRSADMRGPTLVGFFAMGCPPCKELAPRFIDFASTFPGGRDHVWAVIEGEQEDPAWLAALLGRVANVVVEPVRGPAST